MTFTRFGLTKAPHEVVVRPGESESEIQAIVEYFAARLRPPGPRMPALVGAAAD